MTCAVPLLFSTSTVCAPPPLSCGPRAPTLLRCIQHLHLQDGGFIATSWGAARSGFHELGGGQLDHELEGAPLHFPLRRRCLSVTPLASTSPWIAGYGELGAGLGRELEGDPIYAAAGGPPR
uniref:DUF3778 domain-containing protein n=1 Tax=Oryza barthii TaxID=65489 RepID=A0A0D3GGZ4_9ORYZ